MSHQQQHVQQSPAPHHIVPLVKEFTTEGKSVHIPTKSLSIIWGKDKRYWQWITLQEQGSMIEVAELLQVNWLEVTGKLEFSHLSPNTKYEIFWVVKFKVDAFGWHSSPIRFQVATTDGHKDDRIEILETYKELSDQWHEIRGGEFTTSEDSKMDSVEFGMYEISTTWWKGSMIIKEVIMKPKKA
ncbi:uncharacterized protein PHLOEM PROTEIN 2-LIKE A4-like [Tasmannia lanceolata]|uniref:uncharacterized protein PHLOEM PROTEIN 2-LIKE A4-like n=1 Tax=Tasmannia lanceolata TaxID=3420 RepID=UPI0040633293